MAKKISPNAIQSLKDDWGKDASNNLPYSGQAVQDFIKKQFGTKCGCIKLSTSTDANNYYHVWGFATEDDYKQYITDPEGNAGLLLVNEVIPISTVQGDSYGAYLFSDTTANANYVVSGDNYVLKLRFSAVRTSNGERLNMGTMGTLIIQRKVGSGEWTTVETRKDALVSTDYSDTASMTGVEVGNALVNGKQQIRVRAEFEYTAEDGSTKTATSTYVLIGSSVTKTQLDLVCQLNWQTPILASSYTDRGYPASYMVYGAVDKTLHVDVTGGNGQTISVTYPLTAGQDSATISKNITDATDTYKFFQHGVRTVRAWLTADDGKGGIISSKVLVNRFMVINPTTDADKVTPYIMLQNVITAADNYAQADICQYAVFSPKVNDDGTVSNGGDPVSVIFYLTAYSENFPTDNPTEYFRIEENVEPGVQKTLNTTIEIESETEQKTIPAYFRIFRKSGNTEVNFLKESLGQNNLVIQVDNSESYAPKAGADFVLNPKTRNNSESNPMSIINAQTNKEVESTWNGFGLVKDGWVTSDVDGQRVLRIPAGASVNFKYNPFAQFLTTPDSALEIEMDFMVRNVTNENDPIISIFENFTTTDEKGQTVNTFRGLKMCPLHGELHTKSNFVSDETDFSWREGVREHISININNAVAPDKGDAIVPSSSTYDTNATKIALVRVLIKGDIQREFKFSISDPEEFCTAAMSNGGFTIGQSGADIDIYSIRVYQNNALEPTEVLNDYISTLPTTEEKQQERKHNDILTSGKVDMQKCRDLGIRCLVWVGTEPYKLNTSGQNGYYRIYQYDKQGNYLPEYSGTLCKATASLKATRQGSTANTYYYSNLQTKMGDVTATITVPLADLHSSITYEVKENANADGTTTKVVSLKGGNLGKNFPVAEKAVDYPYTQVDGADAVIVPDGWVDGNGKYRGIGYIVAEGTPMAQKLVNKINYASSMQSHLTGVNNLYNDLHKAIVGKNSLQEGYSLARVSKYTEPFLFFTQAPDSDTPVYRGPCTFGAGKMDKPTWGYVKKLHPMFTMIEGSDNNYELTDMRVPFTWNEPDCPENITYSGDDEGFFYGDKQCLDFDAGATQDDEQETPSEDLIKVIQDAWNFLYLHSPFISYYKGTFDQFQLSDAAKNTFSKYWCTDGDDAYKLKRYDFVSGRWIDAGLWNTSTKAWDTFDLRQEEMTKGTYDNSSNQSEYAALNTELRGAIVAHARKYIGFYFRVDSLKLYYTFIIHLMAGTDSCSKNTYYVLDPIAVDVTIDGETRSCYLFEMHTDDVDTMLPIDNNGRATKAYYLDRMHPYNDGDTSTEKYEGMHNVLFTLCEQMWEGTKELQTMLQRIFTAMEGLVSESDYIYGFPKDGQKVSVMGCLWKYIYFVHKYIPQVAYNEAARIRYEYPEMIGFVSFGSGARSVRPITQSNGSLLECELQFIIRRLVLMASYAAWGPFGDGKSGNLGIADASEGFAMQAFHLPDSATSTNTYKFTVTPHQYLYPTGMLGQTVIDPHTRVRPGQQFDLVLGSTSSNDTGMSINGINYYRSIGNVGDLSTTPANTITVNGSRLVEFIAEPSKYYDDMSNSGSTAPAFRPGAIAINARNIQKLSLKGCTGTAGSIDISGLSRLQSVDVRQTRLSDVILPESHALTTVELPSTITEVSLPNQSALHELTAEGYANINSLEFGHNTPDKAVVPFIRDCAANATQEVAVSLDNVAWDESFVMSVLMWMIRQTDFKGTGYVTVSSQLTANAVKNVSDILGEECFYEDALKDGKLFVKTQGGNFLVGPDTIVSGSSADYRMVLIPHSDYVPNFRLADYDRSAVNSDGDTVYYKGTVAINSRTGHLTSEESISDIKVTVQGYYADNMHLDQSLSITKTTYPQEIRAINGASAIKDTGDYEYSSVVYPANYTGHADYLWELASGNTAGLTLVQNGNSCTLKVSDNVPVNFNKVTLRLTVTCGNGSTYSKTKDIFYSKEQPIVTSDTNAVLMQVAYAKGWAANETYMLASEAAAVTDLGDAFTGNTELQHFEQLQYFSGLTAISDNAFKGCTALEDVTLPSQVTTIGAHAYDGCTALTVVSLPYVQTIGDYAFHGCTNVRELVFGDRLESFGTEAFSSMQITELSFGPNVSKISLDAFDDCQKLTTVTVSNNRFLTWGMAFKNCRSLSEYRLSSVEGAFAYLKVDGGIIYRTDTDMIVAVPQACTTFTTTGYAIADYAFYWNQKTIGYTVFNNVNGSCQLTQGNTDSLKSALQDYVAAMKFYVFDAKGTQMAEIKSATFAGDYTNGMTAGTVTFADGTVANIADLNAKGCNFMAYRPKMYFKSFTDDNGREILQQRGVVPIDGGHSFNEKFIGMFKAYNQSGVLKSQPGRIPTGSETIAIFQAQAEAGGRGYGLWNYHDWCKENALHISWFGNTNYEINVGTGRINNYNNVRNIVTGFTLPMLTGDNHGIGTAATVDSAGNAVNALDFFGVEGLGEQIWEFVIGYRCDAIKLYIWDDNSWSETHQPDYTLDRVIADASRSYIREIIGGEHFDMMPRKVGGTSTTGWADGTWANSNNGRLLFVGGDAGDGSICGLSASDSDRGFGGSTAGVGARLAFYGRPTEVTGAAFVATLAA